MRKQALKDHLVKIIHREVASQAWSPSLSNPGDYEQQMTGRKNPAPMDLTQKPTPLLTNITLLIKTKHQGNQQEKKNPTKINKLASLITQNIFGHFLVGKLIFPTVQK